MNKRDITVFGINWGTTYSCITYTDEYGQPVVITNAEGQRTTPSVVFFDGENSVVRWEAKSNVMVYPDQVVELVQRHMGEEGWHLHVVHEGQRVPVNFI